MKLLFIFSFLFSSIFSSAQSDPDKIKIKRSDTQFYFFQLGKRSDTISTNNNLFYLNIPRSKRCSYKIEIQNGQLLKTKSDTVFKLMRVNNINYVHYYEDSLTTVHNSNTLARCSKYKVAIDGANNLNTPHTVQVKFIDSATDNLILVNKFYYK